jgi:hypothetical protein
LLPTIRPVLERMRASGHFLSTALIESACEAVGEGPEK